MATGLELRTDSIVSPNLVHLLSICPIMLVSSTRNPSVRFAIQLLFIARQLRSSSRLIALLLGILALTLTRTGFGASQETLHRGPALDVQIERGVTRLPLAQVNRLHAGDRVLVRPDRNTLTKGGWVLLLARVSARGNQVDSKPFNVNELQGDATIEITDDDQVPVIMLAPQLRNLFGLNTSMFESTRLLDEVLRADPQRFHDLQRADQINQAIQAISRGIERRVSGRGQEKAIQAAREVAARFGVRQVDPDCFKAQSVNTECVATSIVSNRDFVLPGAKDLSDMIGPRKAADLNSFLTADLRVLSQATEYLGSKYRDTYDFAPTFGRRQAKGSRVELYSLTRFRSGSIKTAYIYVPSWFVGQPPSLHPNPDRADCYAAGRLALEVRGTLPLGNYWHDWTMTLSDPQGGPSLADVEGLRFDPDAGVFNFDASFAPMPQTRAGKSVRVVLSGRFGFEAIDVEPIDMALPLNGPAAIAAVLPGLDRLVAGDRVDLRVLPAQAAACVTGLSMQLPDGRTIRSSSEQPARLALDFSTTQAGPAQLTVMQHGVDAVTLPVRILQPAARVTHVEHARLSDSVLVFGDRLDRIARVTIDQGNCSVPTTDASVSGSSSQQPNSPGMLRIPCQSPLPEINGQSAQAIIHHRDNEPGPIQVPLRITAARPQLRVMSETPNGVLVTPSAKALQWKLSPGDSFLTEDSGLSLLLQATPPYRLERGGYQLQLRFTDDPRTDRAPIPAALIADYSHDELRTRAPISFPKDLLPSVVNPLEYRVLHQGSQLASDWQALERSVLMLPDLDKASCAPDGRSIWLHGRNLDLIDGIGTSASISPDRAAEYSSPQFDPCPTGLCLRLPAPDLASVRLRLRWVSGRDFEVSIPPANPACERKR